MPAGLRFALLDDEADRAATGPTWLADPRVARLVQDKIIDYSDSLYDLAAWAIMANHVHIVIQAFTANQPLGRTGKFWQDEYYDHFIRSEDELNRVIRYVERNPVKAGQVDSIEHYQWCSAGQPKGCPTRN
jgi:REP element-mobilizing transposase RayT